MTCNKWSIVSSVGHTFTCGQQMDIWRACDQGDLERVRQLIQDGQDVNSRGGSFGTTPLILAAYRGQDQMVRELIRAGADVNGKDNDKHTALHWASWCGHSSVIKTLAEAGANINVQDKDGMTPLMRAAFWGHANIVVELIRAGADVTVVSSCGGRVVFVAGGGVITSSRSVAAGSTALHFAAKENRIECVVRLVEAGADMRTKNKDSKSPLDLASHDFRQAALHRASSLGLSNVVTTLAEAGANLNEQDERGVTPLMEAAYMGRDNVVVELIRAGADVSVASSRECWLVAAGSTALHFAAKENSIECGVLLVETGADMRTKNKDSKSPLDLASHDFRQAIQQAQSFCTKRIVAVIGYAEHGKSTLIAALQAEGNSLLKWFTNWFTKVQDIRKRTAGIEAVQFSSQKYGETLFYDFAGQSDYHGPHQSFLEAMFSKPGVSVTLLLVVKSTDEEDIITRQVTHWLQPLSLTSAPSTPQVILVGSFLDQVESREEATEKLLRCTQSVQEQFHFNIQGPCLLDCRKPASEGIDQICSFLQENEPVQLNCKTFSYNLRWVLVQLHKTFSVPAVRLHTFQSWLLNDAKLSPQHFPPAEQMCHDLTAVGHTLFLPNKQDPSQSWLIVDLQAILHDVYGTLFSGSQGKVNQFGLLHCSQLTELFPELDSAMIQEVLVGLEFCIQVDSSLLLEELLNLNAKDEGEGWLYFPALVSAQPPEIFSEVPDPHHLQWVCWQLRAAEQHFISAHLLQTIILRLAANHVFTHELSPRVREHCCSVWVNGLSWMSTKDVDIAVQISDSSVVQVVGRSKAGPEKLHQYMSTIVSDVIKTTAQLSPKLEATSYIVHPYTPAMWEGAKAPPTDSLYPVSSIIRCIRDGACRVLSRTRQDGRLPHQTSLTELFGGWSPPLSIVQDMDFKREPQRGELVFPLCMCSSEGILSFASFLK